MTEKLTRAYCKANTLCFHPKTQAEAAAILDCLFDLGFTWPNGHKVVGHLAAIVTGSLHLNYEAGSGYIQYSDVRQTNGELCTLGQFVNADQPDVIEKRRRPETLDKGSFAGKTLLFYPRTISEAAFIQRQLFDLDVRWSTGSQQKGVYEICCAEGMVVVDGQLYVSPSDNDTFTGQVCSIDQFSVPFGYTDLTPEQLYTKSVFNEVSAHIKKQSLDITDIHRIVKPAHIEKKRKGLGGS